MKFFAFILSFYILGLAALPCIDLPEDRYARIAEITQNSNSNHVNDNDNCSPFCICQCCASPVVIEDFIIEFTNFSYAQKNLSDYSPTYVSSLFTAIWQPPKVS
jgi:hypothetical protein